MNNTLASAFLRTATLLLVSCGAPDPEVAAEQYGPLMRPGWNCLSCHRDGNPDGAPAWTAAGTVYPSADAPIDEGQPGVTVVITDASGHEVRMVTNEVGNFYTSERLESPFQVALEYQGRTKPMPKPPPAGSCNACHAQPPLSGAPGRIFAP